MPVAKPTKKKNVFRTSVQLGRRPPAVEKLGAFPVVGAGHENWYPADMGATHMPTEEEIKAECEKIRESWSKAEEKSRRLYDVECSRLAIVRAEDFRHRQASFIGSQ